MFFTLSARALSLSVCELSTVISAHSFVRFTRLTNMCKVLHMQNTREEIEQRQEEVHSVEKNGRRIANNENVWRNEW